MITVNVKNGEITEAEKQAYIRRAHELYPGAAIDSFCPECGAKMDGDTHD